MKLNTGELHIRVTVGESRTLWLCGGSHKESLKHSVIYLDANVDTTKFPGDDEKIDSNGINHGNSSYVYIPSDSRIVWEKKKYVGNECKSLHDLPVGNHILSIAPNITHDKHVTKLSHVVMWL